MLCLVTAVIRPHKLEEVKDALRTMGVGGLSVTDIQGAGRQQGHSETYRGAEYTVDFVPKVKVEVLAAAEDAEEIVKIIASAAHTGRIGDGKVWVTPVQQALRIRTGEMGPDSL